MLTERLITNVRCAKCKSDDLSLFCMLCDVEVQGTETGLMCPKCGAYISDKEFNDETQRM